MIGFVKGRLIGKGFCGGGKLGGFMLNVEGKLLILIEFQVEVLEKSYLEMSKSEKMSYLMRSEFLFFNNMLFLVC